MSEDLATGIRRLPEVLGSDVPVGHAMSAKDEIFRALANSWVRDCIGWTADLASAVQMLDRKRIE